MGNYYSSQQDFLAQLAENPNDALTHFELGKVYMKPEFDTLDNQMQKALYHLDQALLSNPNNDAYLIERAVLKSTMGNTSGAIQDFEKAIAINPTKFEYYNSRLKAQRAGNISTSLRMKGLKNAEAVFKQETQKPRKGPGFMNLSKVYLLMYEEGFPGDWLDSSLVSIEVSLKESQRNADYFFQKGMLFKRGFKDFQEAEVFFKKATDIDPKMDAAWIELAQVIYKQKDTRRAIETLKLGLKRGLDTKTIKSLLDEWCEIHPGDC
jgi:tetratricopeptide (TPR) repeat protein